MGKLVVSENVTLNGVVQDPAGDEGFRLGGWVGLIKDRPGSTSSRLTTLWGPRLCCWVGGATSGSPSGGRRGLASWLTG